MNLPDKIEFEIKKTPILFYQTKHDEKLNCITFHNCHTGKKSNNLFDIIDDNEEYKLIYKKSQKEFACEIIDCKEINKIALVVCYIDTTADISNWEQSYIIYFDQNKDCYEKDYIYKFETNLTYREDLVNTDFLKTCFKIGTNRFLTNPNFINESEFIVKSDTKQVPFSILEYFLQKEDIKKKLFLKNTIKSFRNAPGTAFDVFKKWFPSQFITAGNEVIKINSFQSLSLFLNYNEPSEFNSKKQNQLNNYLNLKLKDISIPKEYDLNINKNQIQLEKFAVIEKIDNNTCLLRTCYIDFKVNKIIESSRFYCNEKEIIVAKRNNDGEYIVQTRKFVEKMKHWDFPIFHFKETETEGTLFAYFGSIMEKISFEKRGIVLFSLLQNPLYEKLLKSCFFDLALAMIEKDNSSTKDNIFISVFGATQTSNENLYTIVGMNPYQVQKIINLFPAYIDIVQKNIYGRDNYRYEISPFIMIKSILCKCSENRIKENYETIAHIDNQSFNQVVELVLEIYQKGNYFHESTYSYSMRIFFHCMSLLHELYSFKCMIQIGNHLKEHLLEHITRSGVQNSDIIINYYTTSIELYYDYLRLIQATNLPQRCSPYFEKIEEVKIKHDYLLKENIQITKLRKTKNWDILSKYWECYLYESEEYSILYPKKPEELIVEGFELNHCVGSYINSVLNNETNILFLRKKTDLEKPFFTIELSNYNEIIQIKGINNCIINKELPAYLFLEEWIKVKKIKYRM